MKQLYLDELHAILPIQTTLVNEFQARALKAILSLEPLRKAPYIIFGPPGTGKTFAVTESILQICGRSTEARILACTASNAAADLVAHRLLKHNPHLKLMRLVSFSRELAMHRLESEEEINTIRTCCTTVLIIRPTSR
jgi:superfamily I DNA/RNA helicase